jgi:UDP-N-acetyl-D-mannosaminuronate dehydrogenase
MDGLIINTAHKDYAEIDYNKIIGLKFIFDGRNMLKNDNNPKKNFK